ncbi:MAG: tetratricopeptide repeat protein, partial [Anaerolineales bacterium]
ALAHAYHAENLIDGNAYEGALVAARRAIELDPNNMESHRALGYVWELTSNYDDAFQEYQAAIRIHPNLSLLYLSLGNMYLAQGDGATAIQTYLQASQLAPTNPEPLLWIAQAYARVGEYGKASQYAEQAMELDTGNPYLHGNLGRMYYKNNQFEDAILELEIAIRGRAEGEEPRVQGLPLKPEDPKVVEFYYSYGLALAKGGRCPEAIPIFETLLLGVPADETAVANATEGLVLCGQIEPTPTPRP